MKTLAASENVMSNLTNWQEDPDYQETVSRQVDLDEKEDQFHARMKQLKESIERLSARSVSLRADQLASGSDKQSAEDLELTLLQMEDERTQLGELERESQALSLAKKRVQTKVDTAGAKAKSRTHETIKEPITRKVRRMNDLMDEAMTLNAEIRALQRFAISQGLDGVIADKHYLRVMRSGAHLDFLNDVPGGPIALWKQHIAGLLS